MGFMLFFSSAKFFSKRKTPCRRRQSWRKPKRTKPTTLAGDDDELVHVRKENRGRNPEPEASLAPNRNAAERRNREADPRARSAENRGADRDVAPLRGPSQNAAAASPDAAPRPREEKGPSPSAAAASPDAALRPSPSAAENVRRRRIARRINRDLIYGETEGD